MAGNKPRVNLLRGVRTKRVSSYIKAGDIVMVIAGGNSKKRANKGKTGKLLKFVGKNLDRVIVEGLNLVAKHQKAAGPDKPAAKILKEGSIHISNVMYYAEKIKKPVKLKHKILADGKKVRGYINPENKEFVQL